jgi:RimJ/RimL family protein N-acetyltransferase
MIETPRLILRELIPDDLDAVHAILDRDLGAGGVSRADRAEWLQWTIASYEQYRRLYQPPYGERAIVLRPGGALIGVCGLVPSLGPFGQLPYFSTRINLPVERRFVPEVGLYWAVGSAHQRQGYATEAARGLVGWAFRTLNLARVVATTTHENAPSISVMRRLDMTVERNPFPDPPWFQVVGILENTG